MLNLLSGEFYKFKKSKSFGFCLLSAAALAALLYISLLLLENIQQSGQGVVITGGMEESLDGNGEPLSLLQRIGVADIVQQMLNSHFSGFIVSVFVSIFVIGEFTDGAVKNIVGKGYSREAIYLSKLLMVVCAAALMTWLVIAITLCLGFFFLGMEGINAINWKDMAVFAAMQAVFEISLAGLVMLLGELTRSLAAGISISIGVAVFSSVLTEGLDLAFHNLGFELSGYWVLDLQARFPTGDFGRETILRGLLVSLGWFLFAALAGTLHFRKADIK